MKPYFLRFLYFVIGVLMELVFWLEPPVVPFIPIAEVDDVNEVLLHVPMDEVYFAAREFVAAEEDRPTSHEYKRHQVLANLIKIYPNRRKRELALAIEAAL